MAAKIEDELCEAAKSEDELCELLCAHCRAGEPSVWDDVFCHYAHPAGDKLKFCHNPWRERCQRCSASFGLCSCRVKAT